MTGYFYYLNFDLRWFYKFLFLLVSYPFYQFAIDYSFSLISMKSFLSTALAIFFMNDSLMIVIQDFNGFT